MTQGRQTISYLTRRFREVGLHPSKRHGQNFLIDLNLLKLLATTAQPSESDVFLEVGTGTGSLTGLLAAGAAHVVTVEIDRHLHQLAREELEAFENITFLHQDALKNKNRLAPEVLDSVAHALQHVSKTDFKLAANLPYNIATPIISNLLRCPTVPTTMTITIQKELADRMMAHPHSKDYGALSVWIQSLCEVSLVRVMPPTVFWPRPNVDSAIVHLIHQPEKRSQFADLEFFHSFVRRIFFHRRKFLRSVAISAFKELLEKSVVDSVLTDHRLGSDTRTEQLTVSQIQALCESFRQKMLACGKSQFVD